ncbi:DUF6318 family protein [Kocuria sp.]|uniref:DUF6318 family protein n=1 Tax=Kocuria sp. TaxID=1871328 RepID=UPI0026E0B81C|nr:DUF6318 family protein [Kocuria sp.]MDO5617297.1 DUF6318 family protein [Kocuria sp.]
MVRGGVVLGFSAVVFTVGVLTGCGDTNDDAGGDPSATSTSASGSGSGSASASGGEYVEASAEGPAQNVPEPTKPALADEESVEGAQAFLDYLSDARAYAQQTGDTSLAREVTAKECQSCMNLYDTIDDLYEAGGWASRGYEKVTVISKELPVDSYGFYAPEVSVDAEDITAWGPGGEVVQEVSGEESSDESLAMHLAYLDGEWTYITGAPVG